MRASWLDFRPVLFLDLVDLYRAVRDLGDQKVRAVLIRAAYFLLDGCLRLTEVCFISPFRFRNGRGSVSLNIDKKNLIVGM
jgi:hypothetical protein